MFCANEICLATQRANQVKSVLDFNVTLFRTVCDILPGYGEEIMEFSEQKSSRLWKSIIYILILALYVLPLPFSHPGYRWLGLSSRNQLGMIGNVTQLLPPHHIWLSPSNTSLLRSSMCSWENLPTP
jgi:hypothetical protein